MLGVRYIITESRLDEFINRYLDNMMNSNIILRNDPYIYIERPDYDEEDVFQYMEWDRTDGRLWINKKFLSYFTNMFAFEDAGSAQKTIADWFEKKFDVEVKFVE